MCEAGTHWMLSSAAGFAITGTARAGSNIIQPCELSVIK